MRGRVSSRSFAQAHPVPESRLAVLGPWREHRTRLLDKAEFEYFSSLLASTGGDVGLAAELSGLKTARLYELLGKHGLIKTRRPMAGIPE
jgi:two-component system NtrC family response regulator